MSYHVSLHRHCKLPLLWFPLTGTTNSQVQQVDSTQGKNKNQAFSFFFAM
jgi:hypothetical protein